MSKLLGVTDDEELSVNVLVKNLRTRCADPQWRVGPLRDGGEARMMVLLPEDLVLAIADGLVDHVNVDKLPTEALIAGAAKDIVKLFVTKLFAPAKDEAERALDACETLGLTEEDVEATMIPPTSLPTWGAIASGLGLAALPLIWGLLKKNKLARGPGSE